MCIVDKDQCGDCQLMFPVDDLKKGLDSDTGDTYLMCGSCRKTHREAFQERDAQQRELEERYEAEFANNPQSVNLPYLRSRYGTSEY